MSKTQTIETAPQKRRPTATELLAASIAQDWWVCRECCHVETVQVSNCLKCGTFHQSELEPIAAPTTEPGEWFYRAMEIAGSVEDLVRRVVITTSRDATPEDYGNAVRARHVFRNQLGSAFDALEGDGARE